MKSIFVIGSRKFYREIEKFVQLCKRNGLKVSVAGKWNKRQEDTLKSEKKALFKAFERIDKSDIVYIFAETGYIGKTVAIELGYAYAKKKELISSEKIIELSAQALISKIMKSKELIKYCK